MKLLRLVQTGIIGALGGVISWVFLQCFLSIQNMVGAFPLFDQFTYQGMIAGLGIGMFLHSREAILSKNHIILKNRIGNGAWIGLLSGFLSFVMGQTLLAFSFSISFFLVRWISWILLGFWLGVFTHFLTPASKREKTRILSLMLGGVVGGLLFEICQNIPIGYPGLIGLILIGGIFPLSMIVIKTYTATACIRVLTGDNQGEMYLVDKDIFSIGYSADNDVILKGYTEVCETHAQIVKNSRSYQVVSAAPGGQVFVNYRFVDQQNMKNGDIIKLGTALLQFCEVP
ncbi:MAG: FHA domain-containing protein [SAR324 cluster bacterium]|nr:FHA domain-containing protein [SAR324 cluster bacterium]